MERAAFNVEWLDPHSSLVQRFVLLHCEADSTVEVYDPVKRRAFIKRTVMPDVRARDLDLGASVLLFSRAMRITGFADEFTLRKLSAARQAAFALIRSASLSLAGKVLAAAQSSGKLVLANAKLAQLTEAQALQLLGDAEPGPVLGFELVCDGDAVGTLRAALVAFAPGVVHVPSTTASAGAAADLFFTPAVPNCVRGYGTSLLLVKPHAVVAGAGGAILDAVLRSFDVTAAALLSLDRAGAEAVLELYRGVVANFEAHVESLTAGPTLALEVALRGGGDVVERLRDLAGPPDPELARILRPATLRALHGADSVRNAVLVTDLAEDAEADVRRLFCAQ